ncbi:ParA family protein [Proteiniphilum propionicum]|jgi:cellulose biosynthesis protein BcsQ|uniref:ParA family protein n=1 Tax=Proteiniphilum propionicum TaxID=2829812 RepID=UPI001EECB8BA|nr:ParA family protein [Proteiniphilum propionicum]ULB35724.1 ParA family protein [Proteiniphilum propionicum]
MKVKCVAFSTQKGGAGKTTLTVLIASYLHYVRGFNVAIVDCDFPQHSISDMRKRDVEMVLNNGYYKQLAYNQITRTGRKGYLILESKPENALEEAQKLENEGLDFIFFDLPGTVNSPGVLRTLSMMDYIFSPIAADRVVLESTLRFVVNINENLVTTARSDIKGLFLFWNMVDGREKSELYKIYEKVIDELGLTVLKTFIPDSKRFRRELPTSGKAVFRSTLFPVDRSLLKGSNLKELTDEILKIIG